MIFKFWRELSERDEKLSVGEHIDAMSDVVRFDIQMRLKYNFQCQLSRSLRSELNNEKRLRLALHPNYSANEKLYQLSIAVMRKVKLVCFLIILIGPIVSSALYPHLCNSYCEKIALRTTPKFFLSKKFQCTKTGFERCTMQITIAIKVPYRQLGRTRSFDYVASGSVVKRSFVLISERYRLIFNLLLLLLRDEATTFLI
ncbi:hypothetical protein T01_13874 [Trichinella spiralis]|uniref:Uncharacterized protein n=1 Tax=Trichinella spiralis TaxID=6334 RepID=A0A0V1BIC4_TRISP|nr:hypothetical protein T01_13874 [Trichinella spiralis]